MRGEMRSDRPTSPALLQLIPEKLCRVIRLLASPTPRIEPISVCELETGKPYHHVARFQITPDKSSDRTMTTARAELLSMSMSTGSRLTMLKATAVPPSSTPRKLQIPEYKTAGLGLSVFV